MRDSLKYSKVTCERYIRTRTAVNEVTNIAATLNGLLRRENADVTMVIYVPTANKIDPAVVKSSEEKYTPNKDPPIKPATSVRIAVECVSSASSNINCLRSLYSNLYVEDMKDSQTTSLQEILTGRAFRRRYASSYIPVLMQSTVGAEDFYNDQMDSSVRGSAILPPIPPLSVERALHEVDVVTPVGKWCNQFPITVSAPTIPTDPLYVFTNWAWRCRADTIADLANIIVECVEGSFNRKCTLKTHVDKVKISVSIPSSHLDVKIKFFSLPEDCDSSTFMVMFRKDSGDWFAFSSLFQTCVKYVSERGFCLSLTPSQSIHQKDHAIITE